MVAGSGVGTPMPHVERMRFRLAAMRVKRAYPGPAGEILAAEILSWEEFGYRLGATARIMQLISQVLDDPPAEPDPTPAHAARPYGGFISRNQRAGQR